MPSRYNLIAVVIAASLSIPAAAEIPIGPFDMSLRAEARSDYVFRGVTRTDGRNAFSGQVRLGHRSGLFGGIGGSNVIFSDNEDGIELDLTLGYGSDLSDIPFLTYEVGIVRNTYLNISNADNLNYFEGFASIKYSPLLFSVAINANYSPDYFNNSGPAIYYSATGVFNLIDVIELSAHAGYQMIENSNAFDIGNDAYIDWSITAAWKFLGARAYLSYLGTDLPSTGRCRSENCAARIVLGASYGF